MSIDALKLKSRIPFFREISQDVLDRFVPYMHEKTYKKGSLIFLEGDQGDEIYFIHSGAVNIYTFEGTKKVVLAYLQEGEYFGEMALIKPGLVRSATAETIQSTILYTLRKSDFGSLIDAYPKIVFHLLDDTMERLRRANHQIYDLTFLNVRTRIIKRLLRLSQERGTITPEGVLINMKITHQQLADMVGSVRETITKVLLELQEEGLISITNKMVLILDPKRIEKLLVEEMDM